MNSNFAWFVVFLNLAAVGTGLTYVALKPAEVKAVLSVIREETADGRRSTTPRTPAARTARPTPAASPTDVAQAPIGAATPQQTPPPRDAGTATPADRPPPRATPAAPPPRTAAATTETTSLRATTQGIYVGPSTSPIRGEQPQPFLYPFRPVRRTFPDNDTVEVEFLVGNFSGRIWNPAEIVLKSPGYPQSEVFRIESWRLDEIATLKYRFPRAELDRRLELLRIVEVRGTQRQSARGEQVAMDRESLMQNFTQQVGADQGLMRLVAGAMGAQVGPQQSASEAGQTEAAVEKDKLELFLPGSPAVAAAGEATFPLDTDARREIAAKWNTVVSAAKTISASADEIAVLVGSVGYEQAMAGNGKTAVLAIMDAKRTYDKTGLDLALAVGRSNDPAVKELSAPLDAMSGEIVNLMRALQDQMKTLDRTFSLGVQGS